jgi:hypothetical protein
MKHTPIPCVTCILCDIAYTIYKAIKHGNQQMEYAWYLDITPNRMFSLGNYPVSGKDGLPLCEPHGRQLELKEIVLYDKIAPEKSPPDHCWVCT